MEAIYDIYGDLIEISKLLCGDVFYHNRQPYIIVRIFDDVVTSARLTDGMLFDVSKDKMVERLHKVLLLSNGDEKR